MRCQLSVGEKTSFLYIYKNTNLWNDRNRSVVFRDLDYLNLCTIKRQDEQNPVSVDLLYHLPPQPSDIDSSWILCRSRAVSSGWPWEGKPARASFFLREQNSRSIFYLVARSTYLHVEITFCNWKHRNFMVHWGRKVTGKNSYRKI